MILCFSFQPPEKRLRNGNIKGYYVGYKDANSTEPYQYKTVDISPSEEMRSNTDLRGLTPYSYYSVVVQAFSLKGAGPRSDPVIVMTMEDGMYSNIIL